MPSARGLTMRKVCDVRLALEQITADVFDERTLTSRIMAEREVTRQDVLNVCDVARDVVVERRNAQNRPVEVIHAQAMSANEELLHSIERESKVEVDA